MNDIITINIPAWVLFALSSLVLIQGFLSTYLYYLKKKIAELEQLK